MSPERGGVRRGGSWGAPGAAAAPARESVLRFLGYPEGRTPRPELSHRLETLLHASPPLLRPAGVWRTFPASEAGALGLLLPVPRDAGAGAPAPERRRALVPARVAAALVTIGPDLEDACGRALAVGEATSALLLDAIGSAAVERAADLLCAQVLAAGRNAPAPTPQGGEERPASRRDVRFDACRVSPGYGDWPLAAQASLFARLPAGRLGVRLLPSLLMAPRKSISFALWLDRRGLPFEGVAGCARCPYPRCLYRHVPPPRGGGEGAARHEGRGANRPTGPQGGGGPPDRAGPAPGAPEGALP